MSEKIVLIDGHSILNRAFYGVPNLSNSQGLHTNGVYGFLNIMFKILDEEQCQYLAVAFDLSAPTFRHKMFDGYKGTRKPMPEELREQVPMIKEVLQTMNIPVITLEGYEADDILGTLSRQGESEGYEVSIISGDRDLLQLATEKTKIRIPKTKQGGTEIEDYYAKDVEEKYGVTPIEFIDLKALMGDTSDNIPGVPGIGEKTASKIIQVYKSIENAYAHVEELKPKKASENLAAFYGQAQLSKTLAAIDTNVPITFNIEDSRIQDLYNERSYTMFKQLEFKNILSRFAAGDDEIQNKGIEGQEVCYLEEAEALIERLPKDDLVGAGLMMDKTGVYGLAISWGETETYVLLPQNFMTQDYFIEKMNWIMDNCNQVAVIDLKPQLKYLMDQSRDNVFDCGIGAYLLNPLKDSYGIDDLARDYGRMNVSSYKDLFGKSTMDKVFENQKETLITYGATMAYTAWASKPALEKQLSDQGMLDLFKDIEMPLIYVLNSMEKQGILVRQDELKAYGAQLLERITVLETEIYERAGETFNINSPKQLGVILFEKLRMPYGKKTKTGYSTSAEILEKLQMEDPIISMILEYRQLTKLKSTYADGLNNYINPTDHRIHGTFNQTITATGRISSTEPNLQNIPIRMELGRLIRKVFIPKEGCIFVDSDYSQIELRVLAHMSGDEHLIQAYKEARDIHRMTASQVFGIPLDEVTDLQRRNAKAVNFGIVYGISSFGLSQDLSISRQEAQEYIQQYFKTYPKVKTFLDDMVAQAKTDGYVTTLFGRRRPVPELKSSNFMQRSFGERIAMNSPIQGTAADIIKIAMIRVYKRLQRFGLKSRLILQIHDELLIETDLEEVETVKTILQEEMSQAADLLVDLEIDTNVGMSWYDAK